MEPTEQEIPTQTLRAKEIDTGAAPLSMENVALALPEKPLEQRSLGSILAPSWDYADLVSQMKLMVVIGVDPNTPTDTPIWEFRNTWRNVAELHFRNLNDLFMIKSWTLNFLLEFRSNFQQVGMFNLVYSNLPKNLEDYIPRKTHYDSFTLQCQLPHRFIFMGEDQDVHVGLKWLSPFIGAPNLYDYQISKYQMDSANTDDYDMGVIRLFAPFKMEVATGVESPDMSVRIYSYLSDVTYGGYAPNDGII